MADKPPTNLFDPEFRVGSPTKKKPKKKPAAPSGYQPVDIGSLVANAKTKTKKTTNRPADVPEQLWNVIIASAAKYGVSPQVLAGIWRVESASTFPNPYVNSSGYGGLFGTTNWNASPQDQADLAASVLRDQIKRTGNLHDALLAYSGGGYSTVPGVTVPTTPAQKVADQTRLTRAKLADPNYIPTSTDLSVQRSQALKIAKQTAHLTDPWVTVSRDKRGFVTGFGEAYAASPPSNVLYIAGRPATQSLFQDSWTNTYDRVFQEFTGRLATPDEQADILSEGISPYTLKDRLSKSPAFKKSPAWKQEAPGLKAQVKAMIGNQPGADDLVRRALAEGWSPDTFQAQVRQSPLYEKGPEYKASYAAAADVYTGIYGKPNAEGQQFLKGAVKNNWSQESIAAALRAQPQYQYSPEMQAKTIGFLDQMGLLIGSRPTLVTEPRPTLPSGGLGSVRPTLEEPGLSPAMPRLVPSLETPEKKKAA